jgi:hypothetical protein
VTFGHLNKIAAMLSNPFLLKSKKYPNVNISRTPSFRLFKETHFFMTAPLSPENHIQSAKIPFTKNRFR